MVTAVGAAVSGASVVVAAAEGLSSFHIWVHGYMGKCPERNTPILSPYFGISSIYIWEFHIWVYGHTSFLVLIS
jgi:hypothetical protein